MSVALAVTTQVHSQRGPSKAGERKGRRKYLHGPDQNISLLAAKPLKVLVIFRASFPGTEFASMAAVTASPLHQEMILENPNENTRSARSDLRRTPLDTFPLVGLAMILTCAAVAYGVLYYCFSYLNW